MTLGVFREQTAGCVDRHFVFELNPKYPGGIAELKRRLASEGHVVVRKGSRHLVVDLAKSLYRHLTPL